MKTNATLRLILRRAAAAGLLALFVCLSAAGAHAVTLDEDNQLSVVLDGGQIVQLIGEATDSPTVRSSRFYYLPFNLRLSQRPDGTPEFLFLKFTTEQRGGASGGLMHFLMEWGPTPALDAELRAKLRRLNPSAELMGPVPLQPAADGGTFKIISGTLDDKSLTPSVVTSGNAPLVPGGKAAAAARLNADGAQLLAATFERARSITDASIRLDYGYTTLAPAAKGYIEFDWSKLEEERESLATKYRRRTTGTTRTEDCFLFFCASSSRENYAYSYEEVREHYKFLIENQVIKLQFDELVSDERVTKIREAFFQFFLNSMTKPADRDEAPPPAPTPTPTGESGGLNNRQGTSYTYNQSAVSRALSRRVQRFDLNYRTSFRRPFSMVGNLASWYNGVRDNPKCVSTVVLNDPFFQHRDINFILDLNAKEIFEEAINYVTINVRKRRSDGRPFEDRVTIDAKHLTEKGIKATLTYARGEDTNPDLYEYQVQWSTRGGKVFPADPPWERGNWEAVTLSAPVVPRTIEVEGDLEAMKASDITRVTVQLHYRRFGQEMEENIQLSTVENKPVVSRRIFMDPGARGYAYRLVLNHKTEGKLALPWAARVGDNYVYATISPELLQRPTLKEAAKEAGRNALNSATDRVLERFSELVGEKLP